MRREKRSGREMRREIGKEIRSGREIMKNI